MEHLIIRGGEFYLPFARSRIKALKATGLAYASQKFDIDGVSIRVRYDMQHEYIHIESGSGFLDMDSGIINMRAYAGELAMLPGIIHENEHAAQYNTAFNIPGEGVNAHWRFKSGSGGQISGRIKNGGGVKGAARIDGSISRVIEPIKVMVPDSTPPAWVPSTEDANLVVKKVERYLMPASMFTGRCRMYVQAMYGRPRFKDSADDASSGEETRGPRLNGYAALDVPRYVKVFNPNVPQEFVTINTSSGVYFDSETGAHWLMNIVGSELRIYPLISSKFGESLRPLLKLESELSATDKEHLEASILSEAYPKVELMKVVLASIPTTTNTMGFGWHWNWDGTKADVVSMGSYEQDHPSGNYRAMDSIHYRLSVSPQPLVDEPQANEPKRLFLADVSTIEDTKQWAALRESWCIIYPLHGALMAAKLTPKYSTPFNCDAPFYVFYTRNELKVCRIKVEVVTGVNELERSAGFGGHGEGYTTGLNGGFYESTDRNPEYYKTTFSVGGVALHEGITGFSEVKIHATVSPKQETGVIVLGTASVASFTFSYTDDSGTVQNMTFPESPGVTYVVEDANILTQYTSYRYGTTETKRCQLVFAAAYNDAESVYFGGEGYTTMSGEARTTKSVSGTGFRHRTTVNGTPYYDNLTAAKESYGSITTLSSLPASSEILDQWEDAYMISKAGAVKTTLEHWPMSEFQTNAVEEVLDPFYTLSGFRTDTPLILPRNKCASSGANGHDNIELTTIVGWV